jgi:hypothetical protein
VFTQVSHIDRPRFVPRPSDQLLNFGCVGHGGVTLPFGSDPLLSSFIAIESLSAVA